jgi:hypothetical protein
MTTHVGAEPHAATRVVTVIAALTRATEVLNDARRSATNRNDRATVEYIDNTLRLLAETAPQLARLHTLAVQGNLWDDPPLVTKEDMRFPPGTPDGSVEG